MSTVTTIFLIVVYIYFAIGLMIFYAMNDRFPKSNKEYGETLEYGMIGIIAAAIGIPVSIIVSAFFLIMFVVILLLTPIIYLATVVFDEAFRRLW